MSRIAARLWRSIRRNQRSNGKGVYECTCYVESWDVTVRVDKINGSPDDHKAGCDCKVSLSHLGHVYLTLSHSHCIGPMDCVWVCTLDVSGLRKHVAVEGILLVSACDDGSEGRCMSAVFNGPAPRSVYPGEATFASNWNGFVDFKISIRPISTPA